MPANGSVGTITVSPRFLSQVRTVLDREQFDLLHFHEPFVPFLSLVVLGLSNSVNVATFHAFGGFSPAYRSGRGSMRPVDRADPRPDRGLRGGAALHRPVLPGRLQGHPERRRHRPGSTAPCRSPAGRTARRTSCSSGRFESRKGLLHLLKAYRILRKTGCQCRLLVVGGGPQEKEMRRYLMTRKLGGVEFLGRVSDDERDALFKTADIYCSPATGRESFGIVLLEAMAAGTAIVCQRHPRLQGRRPARARGPPRAAGQAQGDRRRARPAARATTSSARRWRRSGLERAQEFSWERVTAKVEDYYGFVIRRLAAQGQLPSGFHADVPPSPRVPAPRRCRAGGVAEPAGAR